MTVVPAASDSTIYDRVVSAILDHQPPARAPSWWKTDWPAAFGVSRTLIRPVLVRLANEQIVTLTPNRGATIAAAQRSRKRAKCSRCAA